MPHRALVGLMLVTVLAGCAPTVSEPTRKPAPATSAVPPPTPSAVPYDRLLDRARANPADVDLHALRLAFAQSERYRPYSQYADATPAMEQAFEAGDWRTVLEMAETALAANYVRVRPHFYAMAANARLGRAAPAAHHRAMMDGLLRSIVASGDGRSPETAMVVIDVEEEYDAMAFLRVRSRVQGLMRQAGRAFDRHEVEARDGSQSTLYFDVSLPLSHSPFRPPSR